MTDIEYGVHVSNKYALFLDEAPDPDDLIIHLAAASAKQASTKEDKSKKKDVLSVTTKKPTSDTPQFIKEGTAIKQLAQDASIKQDRTTKRLPFDRSGTEHDRAPKKEGESVRFGADERGGRGANRRGRGGPRGGGGFGHFDQQQQEGGENRRQRGERPPRMSGFGFNNEADSQPPSSEDKFGDRFGERFGETTAPRGRGGRGGPGRGRGRNFRRGGSGGFRGGGGGDFGSGGDAFGTDHMGGGGGAFGSGFGSGFGDFNAGGGFQAPVTDQPPPPADDVFGSSGFGGTFGVSEGFGGDTTTVSGNFGGYFDAGDGQGRPRGRGRGRPRGSGGRSRGRQFDRQSGSDRSGVRPTDKREGAGAHNWGASGDEAAAVGVDTPTLTTDDTAVAMGDDMNRENKENLNNEAATDDKNEPVELTYDEYLAQQGARSKPTFNVRRAGEGETDKKEWKGLVPLAKQVAGQGDNEEAEADEEDDGQPRKTNVVPIQINFIDEAARGGYGSGGRGNRGSGPGRGGGRGSGFGRGGRDRGQPFGFGRGFGTGANFVERRGGSSAAAKPTAPYKMDEEAFPTLAG